MDDLGVPIFWETPYSGIGWNRMDQVNGRGTERLVTQVSAQIWPAVEASPTYPHRKPRMSIPQNQKGDQNQRNRHESAIYSRTPLLAGKHQNHFTAGHSGI